MRRVGTNSSWSRAPRGAAVTAGRQRASRWIVAATMSLAGLHAANATCSTTPRTGCIRNSTTRTTLLISNPEGTAKDSLQWSWSKGASFLQGDLGSPSDTTTYELCLYLGTDVSTPATFTLSVQLTVPPGANWTSKDPKGWQYKDSSAAQDGVISLKLSPGESGRSKIKLKAKGSILALALPSPLNNSIYFHPNDAIEIQMTAAIGGAVRQCWDSYAVGISDTAPYTNTATKFKIRYPH